MGPVKGKPGVYRLRVSTKDPITIEATMLRPLTLPSLRSFR